MGGLLIPLGIIVVMSILGYLMQQLKNASNKQEQQRLIEAERRRKANAAVRTEQRDLDRYLRAVQQQSQQKKAPPPKPVPVVQTARPVRAKLADEPAPFVTSRPAPPPRNQPAPEPAKQPKQPKQAKQAKQAKGQSLEQAAPLRGALTEVSLQGMPTAPVVTRPAAPAKAPKASRTAAPASDFSSDLAGLLKNKNSVALAVVLQEILGKPKSKQN